VVARAELSRREGIMGYFENARCSCQRFRALPTVRSRSVYLSTINSPPRERRLRSDSKVRWWQAPQRSSPVDATLRHPLSDRLLTFTNAPPARSASSNFSR